jgi:hypothetical protein
MSGAKMAANWRYRVGIGRTAGFKNSIGNASNKHCSVAMLAFLHLTRNHCGALIQ